MNWNGLTGNPWLLPAEDEVRMVLSHPETCEDKRWNQPQSRKVSLNAVVVPDLSEQIFSGTSGEFQMGQRQDSLRSRQGQGIVQDD